MLLGVLSFKRSEVMFPFIVSLPNTNTYCATLPLSPTVLHYLPFLPPLTLIKLGPLPGLCQWLLPTRLLLLRCFGFTAIIPSFGAVQLSLRVISRTPGFEQLWLCISEGVGLTAFAATLWPALKKSCELLLHSERARRWGSWKRREVN